MLCQKFTLNEIVSFYLVVIYLDLIICQVFMFRSVPPMSSSPTIFCLQIDH